ncbi:potassium ion transporter [Cryptococcus deuterogattii 99/473]|uniref:Potassium ion transporter n=1 Tax=Cryptococcus deuterogattii Ram5 TaxID=1296110 RepID=A0A0D0V757_9TREE|nr:potassium ion transporter [Cryptococcus deuterogattii Ram5]KIY56976.1 potassium ion transporter [Cryptococcus deuterogattii 99/473]
MKTTLRKPKMPTVTEAREAWQKVKCHFNFFRIHLLVFTFTPFIAACIFYAANGSASGNANSDLAGRQKAAFIDSLFLCFSAMTLSALHPFQQVILFFLFIVGDYSFVSLIMVVVRKHYFRTHCEQLLINDLFRRAPTIPYDAGVQAGLNHSSKDLKSTIKTLRGRNISISGPVNGRKMGTFAEDRDQERHMMTGSPVGMTFEERGRRERAEGSETSADNETPGPHVPSTIRRSMTALNNLANSSSPAATSSALAEDCRSPFVDPLFQTRQLLRAQTRTNSISVDQLGRSASRYQPTISHNASDAPNHTGGDAVPPKLKNRVHFKNYPHHDQSQHPHLRAAAQIMTDHTIDPTRRLPVPFGQKNTGYGGFPSLFQIFRRLLPEKAKRKLYRPVRRVGILMHPAYARKFENGHAGVEESWGEAIRGSVAKWMPEGLQGLVIGRNSRFWTEELDDEELEQIGGVEYRALKLLSCIVSTYIFFYQIIPFAIISIYFAKVNQWNSAFLATAGVQAGTVNKTWFSLFLSASAYTGCGMTLTDQGLEPFQTCYLLIYVLAVGLLVGNHALPIMLRFIIWLGTKITRKGVKYESLNFLLDHPRRCFLYLFPSHQTWYLLLILLVFTVIELFSFLVLNIGLPVVNSLGGWERFSDGLLQSLSVRAAGFGIVAISDMAPSVLFLYIIFMYVAIYPIAMSVRSTNVYEERALGVYEHDDLDTSSEDEPQFKGHGREVFSKYLMWHMRRQLAFDIWPLALAVLMISMFERGKLLDPEKIIFECTSGYATVGLTMGTPNNNYSFSGEFGTASKLVMIVVMLRGRHRGLPVAIDRAILLPREYSRIVKPSDGLQPTLSHPTPFTHVSNEDDRSTNRNGT